MFERPVWAEIDLAAVANHVRQIKQMLQPSTRFCAVVKADGYGHGAVAVARTALTAGADWLAVAIVAEAVQLRRAGFTVPILILGHTPPEQAAWLIAHDISQAVCSLDMVQAMSQAAIRQGKKARIHIKVDTGMGRLGIQPEETADFTVAAAAWPGVCVEGIFSHFATADAEDKSFAEQQFAVFTQCVKAVEERGIHIPIRHIANSAATLEMPHTHLDMVRPGIILYGLWPSPAVRQVMTVQPAMKLKARIAFVKDMPPNRSVSYGRTYFTRQATRMATLPLGYADGWSRLLAEKADVLVRGCRAPIRGRICMDQCMVDVGHIPGAAVGDEALLFGTAALPADEVAAHLGTINYEVVCMVGNRVPRLYVEK